MTETNIENETNRRGRPSKTDLPRVPYDEVDQLLVFGEFVETEDDSEREVVYPSYREISQRYGVSHSLIAQYAKKHDCLKRRERVRECIKQRAEEQIIERRAIELVNPRSEEIRIINGYLSCFAEALLEGRIGCTDPNDFSIMVRLKQYLQGGADSRQEIHRVAPFEQLLSRWQNLKQEDEPKESAESEDSEDSTSIDDDSPLDN